MRYVIVADKHSGGNHRRNARRRRAFYSARLPGWTPLEKDATFYTDKAEAERDMRKAGQPHGERGWSKWVRETP